MIRLNANARDNKDSATAASHDHASCFSKQQLVHAGDPEIEKKKKKEREREIEKKDKERVRTVIKMPSHVPLTKPFTQPLVLLSSCGVAFVGRHKVQETFSASKTLAGNLPTAQHKLQSLTLGQSWFQQTAYMLKDLTMPSVKVGCGRTR